MQQLKYNSQISHEMIQNIFKSYRELKNYREIYVNDFQAKKFTSKELLLKLLNVLNCLITFLQNLDQFEKQINIVNQKSNEYIQRIWDLNIFCYQLIDYAQNFMKNPDQQLQALFNIQHQIDQLVNATELKFDALEKHKQTLQQLKEEFNVYYDVVNYYNLEKS